MSSIFIGRGLATIGEITWIVQVALGFMRANREIKTLSGSKGDDTFIEKSIDFLAISAAVLCTIAEFFCNYGMVTENYLYNVGETVLWNIALGGLIAPCVYLYYKSRQIKS